MLFSIYLQDEAPLPIYKRPKDEKEENPLKPNNDTISKDHPPEMDTVPNNVCFVDREPFTLLLSVCFIAVFESFTLSLCHHPHSLRHCPERIFW